MTLRGMTLDDWILETARIGRLWHGSKPWSPSEVKETYEMVSFFTREEVGQVLQDLAEDGDGRAPNAGAIRKRGLEMFPSRKPMRSSKPCVCAGVMDGYETCPAGHPEGWLDRRRRDHEAWQIQQRHKHSGVELNPRDYPEHEASLLGLQVRAFYDANREKGRAIQDPGDENGSETIPWPKRHELTWSKMATPNEQDAKQLLELIGRNASLSKTLEQEARRIVADYQMHPEAWSKKRIESLDEDIRTEVRQMLRLQAPAGTPS